MILVKKPLLKGDLSKHRKECDDLLQSNRYFGASHNIYVARVIHDGVYGEFVASGSRSWMVAKSPVPSLRIIVWG